MERRLRHPGLDLEGMRRGREEVAVPDGDQRRRLDRGDLLQRLVADARLGLIRKGFRAMRMGVRLDLALELGHLLGALLEVSRREHPEPDLAGQVERRRYPRVALPAADQRGRTAVGPPPAAVERQRANELRVPYRQLLGD